MSLAAKDIELDRLEEKWGSIYPIVIKSWCNKGENLSYVVPKVRNFDKDIGKLCVLI